MVKKPAAVSPYAHIITDAQAYLNSYVTFSDPQYSLALALWLVATYLWPNFDAFPYLVITSDTKRSGKTRLSEILSFAASNPRNIAGMTAATVFRSIKDENPTMFMDEAESLSAGSADTMRSVLNVGYRKGQTIPRMGKGGVIEQWPAYCPKVFVLIGDVYDTLRDRSIIVRMRRGDAPQRFLYEIAKGQGDELGQKMKAAADDMSAAIFDAYMSSKGLGFLQDRDEEIWMPLFAVASAICPERMDELTRAAVDMATEKTAGAKRHSELEMRDAEREATDNEYAERLLADLAAVMGTRKAMFTAEALTALHDLPTGPWRKFRGAGLSAMDMSNLLSRFKGVAPRLVRNGRGRASQVARGYRSVDVMEALKEINGGA